MRTGQAFNGIVAMVGVFLVSCAVASGQTYSVIDLGDLPGGDDYSSAQGINDAGQVAGYSKAATGGRAFLWDPVNGMQDLNDLLDATGVRWTLEYALAINEQGWIVGGGLNPDGAHHAFLLVPEPSSLLLLALGGLAVMRRRR